MGPDMFLVALMPFPVMLFIACCGVGLAALLSLVIALVLWPHEFKD